MNTAKRDTSGKFRANANMEYVSGVPRNGLRLNVRACGEGNASNRCKI